MCSALAHVCFGPKADMPIFSLALAALVIVCYPPHVFFGFFVLQAFSDAEGFFCAKPPALRIGQRPYLSVDPDYHSDSESGRAENDHNAQCVNGAAKGRVTVIQWIFC